MLTITPPPPLAQDGQHSLGNRQQPDHVGVELTPNHLHRRDLQGAIGPKAGIVDQHIDPAEALQRRADRRCHGGLVGDIQAGDQHRSGQASSWACSGLRMLATTFHPCW